MSTTVVETVTTPAATFTTAVNDINLDSYDEEQVRLMEERCILVTPEDKVYGEGSKKVCEWKRGSQLECVLAYPLLCRSPHVQHQHWSSSSCFFRFPFPPHRWSSPPSKTCRWEDNFPQHVDQYLLLSPFEYQSWTCGTGPGRCVCRFVYKEWPDFLQAWKPPPSESFLKSWEYQRVNLSLRISIFSLAYTIWPPVMVSGESTRVSNYWTRAASIACSPSDKSTIFCSLLWM